MTTEEQKDFTFVNIHYGVEAQSRQAMEECAELIQAVNKCLRVTYNGQMVDPEDRDKVFDHLAEEIADVGIMLDELSLLFGIPASDIERIRAAKIERTVNRIMEESK